MNERHLHEAAEVLGRLLEAGEDAAAFLHPSDEVLDDAPFLVFFLVEFHRPRVAVLVGFGGNDGLDLQFEKKLVDPCGSVAFVSAQRDGPGDGLAFPVGDFGIGFDQQGVEDSGVMDLAGRQVEVQRMAVAVAQDVDFRRESAARTA